MHDLKVTSDDNNKNVTKYTVVSYDKLVTITKKQQWWSEYNVQTII